MKGFPLTADKGPQVVKTSAMKEKTVPMYFKGPDTVRLALPDSRVLMFPPGVQQVPESLVDHIWLKAHGAKKVEVNEATAEQTAAMQPDKKLMSQYAEFFTLRGYKVDVNGAALKLDRMASEPNGAAQVASFLQDFADNYITEKANHDRLQALEAQRADNRAKLETVLTTMRKEELAVYAKQQYALELDSATAKKPDMIQAILNAADAKEEAGAITKG